MGGRCSEEASSRPSVSSISPSGATGLLEEDLRDSSMEKGSVGFHGMSVVRADPTTFNYVPFPAAGSDACLIAQGQVPDDNEDSEVIEICDRSSSR